MNLGPCINAKTCKNTPGSFECICKEGYGGPTCAKNIDDCVGQCKNGATCIDLVNAYYCDCATGYTGKYMAVLRILRDLMLIPFWIPFRSWLCNGHRWMREFPLREWRRVCGLCWALQMHLPGGLLRNTLWGKNCLYYGFMNKSSFSGSRLKCELKLSQTQTRSDQYEMISSAIHIVKIPN